MVAAAAAAGRSPDAEFVRALQNGTSPSPSVDVALRALAAGDKTG